MRGVPRERRAISHAPASSSVDVEDAGRPHDDRLQLGRVVVVEAGDEPEAVAQRPGDHARAGRRPDERERRQRQADARCRRALADDDVELEVLHRRVQDLLDRPRQAVDLVDEQDVALLQLGEDRRQVAGPFQRRARRDVQGHAHLGGGDAGQRRLAEPGRAGEQQVVDGLAAPPGGLDDDRRGAPSARAGRRTRRAGAVAARPRRRPRRRRRRPASRNSSRTAGPEQLERVAQQRRRVGVGRQLAQRLADLLRARSRDPASASRTSPIGRAGRRSPPTGSSTGTDRRLFSSTSSRSAVFLPTPGTSVSAARSPLATMSTRAAGGWVARIAIASAGPTPWVAMSVWNVARSVAAGEAVQRLAVLADVVVDVEERRRRRLQLGQRPRRDDDVVADAADLEQHDAVEPALEHRAAQRADHVGAPGPFVGPSRRRRGRASGPSPGGTGPAPRRRRRRPAAAGRPGGGGPGPSSAPAPWPPRPTRRRRP